MIRAAVALPLLGALALASGCGDPASYELSWTIGCAAGENGCKIENARQCSAVGIDAIAVRAVVGGSDEGVTRFPCFDDQRGPSALGPDLPGGAAKLSVSGLGAGGQRISGPVDVDVRIPDTGYSPVAVQLPLPVQCADGADNDGDGLVDLLDPDCSDIDDTSEGPTP